MTVHPHFPRAESAWCAQALRAVSNRQPVILITVVADAGSVPRPAGTSMLVLKENSVDTIGGGQLEYRAIAAARELMAADAPAWTYQDVPLGPAVGQCCGGRVSLIFERLDQTDMAWLQHAVRFIGTRRVNLTAAGRDCTWQSGPETAMFHSTRTADGSRQMIQPLGGAWCPLALFGAGHVGAAICQALSPLPFHVTLIDSRPDRIATLRQAHEEVTFLSSLSPALDVSSLVEGSWVLIMTHRHDMDFDIMAAALGRTDLAYVGLIGSATKRARFLSRFHAQGGTSAAASRLVCPIGLPEISGKHPAVIAASVAADLLRRLETTS